MTQSHRVMSGKARTLTLTKGVILNEALWGPANDFWSVG